jgi:class 3 adenylate cyclase
MRLRRKITVAFFLVSSVVSLLLALFLYRFIEGQLRDDLRSRLRNIAHVGAAGIDRDAYARLSARTGAAVSDADVAAIEASADYKRISDQLNAIRDAERRLLRYAYLLMPSDDPDHPRFVVDADVIEGNATRTEDPLSHFNQPYEVKDMPSLGLALRDCIPVLEREFVYDPDFKVYSVSAYYPLGKRPDGTCTGILGVDITDEDMRAALDEAGGLAIKVSLAVIALALVVSIIMGTLLTRSIVALSETVERFAHKDFRARTQVATKDEIGQLGKSFNVMAETIQAHSENLEHLVAERTSELEAEKQTSERLLLNVLPSPIADRLKLGEGVIVDRFDSVTVLFADIVGFTALSSRTSPEALVSMLNELFSAFDRLAEVHGLEKIKTIGDAYMVVSGIPQPRDDHAQAMARMALDMLEAIRDYDRKVGGELTIRVGLHSGSVVAGVIGTKKFIYDLWGDTVNTASRMESSGVPGRVHVTAATRALLGDAYEFEPPRQVDIKGKGLMSTYLIIGPDAQASSSPPEPPEATRARSM